MSLYACVKDRKRLLIETVEGVDGSRSIRSVVSLPFLAHSPRRLVSISSSVRRRALACISSWTFANCAVGTIASKASLQRTHRWDGFVTGGLFSLTETRL